MGQQALVLLWLATGMAVAADDPIKEVLDAARTAYGKQAEAAASALTEALDAKVQEVAGKKDLDGLKVVKAQRDAFVQDGTLPASPLLATARAEYSRAVRAAKADLQKALEKARGDYTQAVRIREAEAVDAELQQLKAELQTGKAKDGDKVKVPTKDREEARWTKLFDGATLNGWSRSSLAATTNWAVERGAISGKGGGRAPSGSLVYSRPLTDFAVRVRGYGSEEDAGLMLRAAAHNGGEAKGYLVSLCPAANGQPPGTLTNFVPLSRGGLLAAAKPTAATREGEYEVEAACVGDLITVSVNGREVVSHRDAKKLYSSGLLALRCGKKATLLIRSVEVQDRSAKR